MPYKKKTNLATEDTSSDIQESPKDVEAVETTANDLVGKSEGVKEESASIVNSPVEESSASSQAPAQQSYQQEPQQQRSYNNNYSYNEPRIEQTYEVSGY